MPPAPDTSQPPPAAAAEAALLARLKLGEESAYEELVRLAGDRMLAVARRLLHSEQDAQDAVQEAFLNAFKHIDRFDGRSQLTTWLHRITVNAALMKLRSAHRRPERSIEDLLPQFSPDGHPKDSPRAWNPAALTGIEDTEMRSLVRAKIDELPDAYQQVLLVRDIAQVDTEAAATLLGISVSAVKTRLHRARQALRSLLDPYFAENNP